MIRYSEEEYRAMLAGRDGKGPAPLPNTTNKAGGVLTPPCEDASERGRRTPFRSKLEAAYAGYLHSLMLAGDIQRYSYEPIRLNLAPKTTLTPDFLVVLPSGSLEFHETKGWARDDAMAKLKIAARLYPQWKFWLVKRKRGVWEQRELPI